MEVVGIVALAPRSCYEANGDPADRHRLALERSTVQAKTVRIGTRGSPLALAQAREVEARLAAAHAPGAYNFDIRVIRTSGDRIQDRPLSEAGGSKGFFTKEIEEALLADAIDIAVHSMKDVPTLLPPGLAITCYLPRQDVRDAFIGRGVATLTDLPAGAVVATSSLRRQAQVRRLRPDLQVQSLRGNVETRLKKLADGVAQATILAMAGLSRLGLQDRVSSPLSVDVMLPAVAQGAVGIETRADDFAMTRLIAPINHQPTGLAVAAERAFLAKLDGSCRTPIAGLAELSDDGLLFRGMILTPDGREWHETARQGPPQEAIRLAEDAAAELIAKAGPNFLRSIG
jgi:hydroxymethylbilane synthase